MNTSKQINVMVGLLFVGLLGTLLYFLWDTTRADEAIGRQELVNVERGARLYSLNCRSCHGLTGQGALEQSTLPGAPLNVDTNRPPKLLGGALQARQQRFHDTLVCGRIGTVMPPWSIEQGGALNNFQIEQLVLLITSTFSPQGWEFALEEANHADAFTPHKHLTAEVGEDDTTLELNDVAGLEPDQTIRIGGETMEDPYEVLLITAVDEDANEIKVERASAGTKAIAHDAESEVFRGPIPPGTTITGDPESPGFPPCGQKAAAAAPSPGGNQATTDLPDAATIEMGDNYFQLAGQRNPSLKVPAGQTINVTLQNIGTAVHNLRINGSDFTYDTDDDIVSDPDLITGGQNGTIAITLNAGTYDYRCDFHPVDMAGTITAE